MIGASKVYDQLIKDNQIETNANQKNLVTELDKFLSNNKSIDFLGIYYANNKLTISHLQRKNNFNTIKDFVQINTPADLIGEFKIEKATEVTRIINDVIKIFELLKGSWSKMKPFIGFPFSSNLIS